MNSLKIAYILIMTLTELAFLALAVAAPVWITPDYYWWTVFGILMMFMSSHAFSQRLNSWGDIGEI